MTGDTRVESAIVDNENADERTSRKRGPRRWGKVAAGPRPAWHGAAVLLALTTAALVGWNAVDQASPGTGFVLATQSAINLLIAIVASAVLTGLAFVTVGRFKALPWWYLWTLGTCLILLLTLGAGASRIAWLLAVAVLVAGSSLLGAALGGLLGPGRRPVALRDRRLVVLGLAVVFLGGPALWLFTAGQGPAAPSDAGTPATTIKSDPAAPGPFEVSTLSYGSGSDTRERYGQSADLRTEPVDASDIIKGWDGQRESLWGFGTENLPLNAQVWYPQGDGPFPLVLIAHGNKSNDAASEAGFGYLGELLASQGFITASVDQNFLNTSVLDRSGGLSGVDVARGWLLLEHLRAWDSWNQAPEGQFAGKVDMGNIGLIGHSRGGEAIAVASYLEGLDRLPGNESVSLDHEFDIRSLLALAPADGQYQPDGEPIHLEDVNYLALQGSHDADVTTFGGLNQYERISFSGDEQFLKAALYVARANHGQFNSRWGNRDVGDGLTKLFIDAGALIPAADQRRIAQMYASSFLRTTLTDDSAAADLLRDHRAGGKWLPETNYVNQFSDSSATTANELTMRTEGFRTTDDVHLPLRGGPGNDIVRLLEWDRGEDAPALTTEFSPATTQARHLVFDAVANTEGGDLTGSVRVRVTDGSGRSATVPLAQTMPLEHLVRGQYLKSSLLHSGALTEPVLQTYRVPLTAFTSATNGLDPADIRSVTLLFDNTKSGSVFVDDLRLTNEGAIR
ncbi:alpha/beta hydrolase [Amycolatopsis marina]|uniref:alpha/beta hydrolase n=1 Tax=Amycolatopsis marina TaxID=490629 RepID=UPI001FEB8C7E|nr:alpha/beta hydrolase [Amycolatopsis marina]